MICVISCDCASQDLHKASHQGVLSLQGELLSLNNAGLLIIVEVVVWVSHVAREPTASVPRVWDSAKIYSAAQERARISEQPRWGSAASARNAAAFYRHAPN